MTDWESVVKSTHAVSNTAHLRLPECEPGVGSVIRTPDSQDLLIGACVRPCALSPDGRGYSLEVPRTGEGLTADYSGTIKAFHYHQHQADCWAPAAGMLQVPVADLRRNCAAYGVRDTLYVRPLRPWQIPIAPQVAHGYKVTGKEPAAPAGALRPLEARQGGRGDVLP